MFSTMQKRNLRSQSSPSQYNHKITNLMEIPSQLFQTCPPLRGIKIHYSDFPTSPVSPTLLLYTRFKVSAQTLEGTKKVARRACEIWNRKSLPRLTGQDRYPGQAIFPFRAVNSAVYFLTIYRPRLMDPVQVAFQKLRANKARISTPRHIPHHCRKRRRNSRKGIFSQRNFTSITAT